MWRCVSLGLIAWLALAAPASAGDLKIEVTFSDKLMEHMDTLNKIEREREENFRKFYDDYRASLNETSRRFDRVRFGKVAWAGTTLIPNIKDFTVENFIKALVKENLHRAGFDQVSGVLRVHIDRIKVANHSLAFLSGRGRGNPVVTRDGTAPADSNTDTYVLGSIQHFDSNGQSIKSVKIKANFLYKVTVDNDYQGPGFAFSVTDPSFRMGPALTCFIEKGLNSLFSTKAFYGAVLVGP